MLGFLLAGNNLPFTIALALMFTLAGLEMISFMMGFGLADLLDQMLPDWFLDAGLDADVDADAAETGGVLSTLGWLGVGKAPTMVLVAIFLTVFGLIGLVMQFILFKLTAQTFMLPGWIAWLPVLIVSLAPTRWAALTLARVAPHESTSVVSEASFIGRVATVTTGVARFGDPAPGKVRDTHDLTHYILIEPNQEDQIFESGTEVILVSGEHSHFRAVPSPLAKTGAAGVAPPSAAANSQENTATRPPTGEVRQESR